MNFWQNLPIPFSVLAPMEDVTDVAFRKTMIKAARPDVFFTEFTSIDGMDSRGVEKVTQRLVFDEIERPIVAQIWGKDPEKFYKAAADVKARGFDGVDINMGCPARDVIKIGCGVALSMAENRKLVGEIIQATKEGVGGLPVSVKTRLGNMKKEEGWVEFLLDQEIAALTLHARTAKEMSLMPARWEEIGEVVKMGKKGGTKIVGNGDIKSLDDPRIEESGVDGVMIGRGVFEDPWVFERNKQEHAKQEKIDLLKYHLEQWEFYWKNGKNERKPYKRDLAVMKKFFKMYIRGWEGAVEMRAKLMETTTVSEAMEILVKQIA